MKYEYCIINSQDIGLLNGKVDTQKLQDEMNQLGSEGWELVSSLESNKNGYTKEFVFVFKRKVEE